MKPDLIINTPIWNSRSIGVNVNWFMTRFKVLISIAYKDKHGNKVYPELYYMTRDKAREYPTQMAGKGRDKVELVIIPIADLFIFSKEQAG